MENVKAAEVSLRLAPHQAILLIAHGSVLHGAERDVHHLAEGLRRQTGARVVEVGFLDYTEPFIPQAVAACAEQGATHLLVLPYFLTSGYLLRKCLAAVQQAAANHPPLTLTLAQPLGPHRKLADLVLERVEQTETSSSQN